MCSNTSLRFFQPRLCMILTEMIRSVEISNSSAALPSMAYMDPAFGEKVAWPYASHVVSMLCAAFSLSHAVLEEAVDAKKKPGSQEL